MLFHDCVLTRTHLFLRGLTQVSSCALCDLSDEFPLHLFRDCRTVRDLWMHLVPTQYNDPFFQSTLLDWLTLNMKEFRSNFEGMEWNATFILTCWWIWKMHIDKVINKGDLKVDIK